MQPTAQTDYKSLFSQLIKKQMLVLGPDITLAKARNVIGLTVDLNGDVQKIDGDPQVLLQGLINQFVELSGMIVKKTMESILTSYPGMMAIAATGAFGAPTVTAQSLPTSKTEQAVTATPSVDIQVSHEVQDTSQVEPIVAQIQSTSVVPSSEEPVSSGPNKSEPPPMSSMDLGNFAASNKANEHKDPGESFTNEDMADLNKALEELSKAPLSTEKPVA